MFFIFLLPLIVVVVVLIYRVSELTHRVEKQNERLARLEAVIGTVPAPSEAAAAAGPPRQPEQAEPRKTDWNIEALIGGSLLNRVGVVAVIVGTGFFLKYAFDNRWVGETGRVILGLIAGLIFLALGERYLRNGYRRFSQGLTGGGIALLYLSIYSAFSFYSLIPQVPAFLFMALVTVASITLAVRNNAISIAMLATLGGFMTPFLLSTKVDNQVVLFTYIFLLNLGVLAVAYFKNWRLLNYQSFLLTVLSFAAWAARFYTSRKLWPTLFFLTLFFIVFALLAIQYNIVHRRKASPAELLLVFLNAGIYFAAAYVLLREKHHDYLGLFSLAMAGVYVGLGHVTNARHRQDPFLVWVFLGLAATFATLAVPIQLDQNWVTIGWAVEGAALGYIAFRYESRNTMLACLGILAIVCIRLVFFDSNLPFQFVREEFSLLLNRRTLSFVVGIATLLFSAHLLKTKPRAFFDGQIYAVGSLLLAANILAIILLSVECYDYLRHLYFQEKILWKTLLYAQQMSLSIIWAVYATFLIVTGIRKGYGPLRYLALFLFGITILKVFLFDLSELERFYRIISFVALGIILIAVSFLYQKYKDAFIGTDSAEGNAP